MESEDFEILSNSEDYIGDLDSDDYESAEFKIKLKSKEKEVTLPVLLEYRDSSNNFYSEQKDITLYVRSAKELGQSNGNTWWIIIILVIVGYFIYKRWKKKKRAIQQ